MPIAMQRRTDEIRFTIWGSICQQIADWEFVLDEMVFNEQLATGSFQGRYEVDEDQLTVMRLVKAQGKILPYYGTGGTRGSCAYALQRTDRGYSVKVENTTVKESTEFTDEVGEKPSAEPALAFKIDGKELQNLRSWKHWHEEQASSPRYIYRFGVVSMGRLGYTVRVQDTQTNDVIDATDYDDW